MGRKQGKVGRWRGVTEGKLGWEVGRVRVRKEGKGGMWNEGVAYLSHIPHTYILLLCEVIDLVAVPEHSNVFCSLTQSHHDWAASHHLPCTPGREGKGWWKGGREV